MYEFKRFGEKLHQAKGSMSTISGRATGNNVDGEAVMYAYGRLKDRTERRKILLTLSDGEPAFYTCFGREYCEQHLRDVIDFVTKRDVECVGIGIQSRAVARFYPKYAVVNRLEDLAGASIDMLAKLLVGDRYVVDNAQLMKVGGSK
jgi:cobalamin biosynthesis protein CobT